MRFKINRKDENGMLVKIYWIQFKDLELKITFCKYIEWQLVLTGGNSLDREELLFVETILRGLNSNG